MKTDIPDTLLQKVLFKLATSLQPTQVCDHLTKLYLFYYFLISLVYDCVQLCLNCFLFLL